MGGSCGWCTSTQSCIPGDYNAPSCRNYCFNRENNWIHGNANCPGGPTSGYLKNIASESNHRLIKPETR